ncbi:ADP-specific phosphofructokinase [Methanolobus halotolerans]|uniref:ADP-specific phosphofructokinase n=1 Tax=Methanolobus halotolerans TaxID=2052935 RepID=A0A4E0PU26_9EURY|nr:ADP-specific phosphofructokinase [Methanolobus halotolerans]TGC08449.1 ADP-specific phosphofructokinase [Methanolobus halotolerans]
MEIEDWEKQYAEAFENIKGSLSNIRGVFVAYNSNIDAIKHINEEEMKKLVGILGCGAIQEKMARYPRVIDSPVDFMARLIISMRDGKAAEVPTHTVDLHDWLMDNLVFDYARMGGQAGIMSNLLANLGLNKVITYVPWLSEEQAEYFVDTPNLKYPAVEDSELVLKHPKQINYHGQKPKVNWIIEFSKGMNVCCAGECFTVPRDNRLIVSSRPDWLRIDMDSELYERIPQLRQDIDGAILAGYQIIREEYGDGLTYHHYVEKAVNVIESLKACNADMPIHVEFTSIQNKVIRKAILTDIVKKHVTSLGLDTVEVANALNVLGYEELAFAVMSKDEKSVIALYEGAVILLKELELQIVNIHSLGHFISLVSEDHPVTIEDHREALLFASILAATQASIGKISSIDDAEVGLRVPVYEKGYEDLQSLAAYLIRQGICSMDEFEEGCVNALGHSLVIVPTKVVHDPAGTVGIGDAISAGAFAALLTKIRDRDKVKCPE